MLLAKWMGVSRYYPIPHPHGKYPPWAHLSSPTSNVPYNSLRIPYHYTKQSYNNNSYSPHHTVWRFCHICWVNLEGYNHTSNNHTDPNRNLWTWRNIQVRTMVNHILCWAGWEGWVYPGLAYLLCIVANERCLWCILVYQLRDIRRAWPYWSTIEKDQCQWQNGPYY